MNQAKGGMDARTWEDAIGEGPQHHLKKDQIDVITVQVPTCNQPAPNNN